MSLLEARGVTKTFGTLTALSNADLLVGEGEFHGLIGPNGSGKSTLLKCIAGAEAASHGTIKLGGQDITYATAPERARAGLSLKFQITAVLAELSVYDNVLLALQAQEPMLDLMLSRSRRALHERTMLLLSRFQLESRRDELAGVLSHGQQQWLEIAMALAREPKLLLLDEPTAGMSRHDTNTTIELLKKIKARGMTKIIIEHDMHVVFSLADRISVLAGGRVIVEGPPDEVRGNPKVQEAYLGGTH